MDKLMSVDMSTCIIFWWSTQRVGSGFGSSNPVNINKFSPVKMQLRKNVLWIYAVTDFVEFVTIVDNSFRFSWPSD